ncbi:MAG: MopE-related protein [Myxococcota bacterium]
MLSLQAFAGPVAAQGSIQQAVAQACNSGTPVVIELQTDDRTDWFIGPGGVNGDLIEYPAPGVCGPNFPPITIRGSDGPAYIHMQPQATATEANLMTFTGGARVTLENVVLVGRTTAEDANGLGSEFAPLCAALGDQVRGVRHTSAQTGAGSLTVNDATFRCLDAPPTQVTRGGAIYSEGVPLTITNSVFDANQAEQGEGGAVAMIAGNANLGALTTPSMVIDGAVFLRNYANFGGAILNTVPGYAVNITDANFDLNVGRFGAGAVLLENNGDVVVERSVLDRQNIDNFEVGQQGGALLVRNTNSLLFRNNLVCGSWAGAGGGVYAEDPGPTRIQGSIFAENGAVCYGGGLFIDEPFGAPVNDVSVVNNTFIGNEAGRAPAFSGLNLLCAYGGGGGAAFWGVNPDFRNNVVAYQTFGGGVLGHYEEFRPPPAYQIGDAIGLYNNIWYTNNDSVTNSPGHVTGDFASVAFHPSNLVDVDPQIVYPGVGEFNCAPDAFYPARTSPAVNNGGGPVTGGIPGNCVDMVDTSPVPDFDHDSPLANDPACDIGAFGGDYGLFAKDTDGDGVQNLFDCNDNDSTVRPGAPEVCDFIDNDCNGVVDDNLDVVWYFDADGDGYGSYDSAQELSCTQPIGKVANNDDCNDQNAAISPGAAEICDSLDNNCNGDLDEGLPVTQWFLDTDNDGFGDNASLRESCQQPAPTYIQVGNDCNDGDPNVFPGRPEICDGLDNDCDGLIDAADPDAVGVQRFRVDGDGDGFGPIDSEQLRCAGEAGPEGLLPVEQGAPSDCDDGNPDISPAAQEICANKDVDEDCDGLIDELDGNTADIQYVYADADGDGLGDNLSFTAFCPGDTQPAGVLSAGDCDDSDPLVGQCPDSCGCQSTVAPAQGMFAMLFGLGALLVRRRR